MTTKELTTSAEKAAYSVGYLKGREFKGLFTIEPGTAETAADGFTDALNGKEPLIPENEIQNILAQVQQQLEIKQKSDRDQFIKANRAASDKFLAANKKKKEVLTTTSGIQYTYVTRAADGAKPLSTSVVKVHYELFLPDLLNTLEQKEILIDSSIARGQPAEFALSQVIAGWSEIVQMMNVGDKVDCYIPSFLGYGDNGVQNSIPPGQLLHFKIELLAIVR